MTDKEIIIDGVDVSECEHQYYKKCKIDYEEWNNEIIRYNECQNNPNCHFKQLKRKEQECERWKKANDEKNELLAKMGCPTVATAKRNVFTLQQQLDQIKAKNIKISKTLTEIKEIAELFCNACQEHEPEKRGRDCIYCNYGKILQKIRECKGEYNEKIR